MTPFLPFVITHTTTSLSLVTTHHKKPQRLSKEINDLIVYKIFYVQLANIIESNLSWINYCQNFH